MVDRQFGHTRLTATSHPNYRSTSLANRPRQADHVDAPGTGPAQLARAGGDRRPGGVDVVDEADTLRRPGDRRERPARRSTAVRSRQAALLLPARLRRSNAVTGISQRSAELEREPPRRDVPAPQRPVEIARHERERVRGRPPDASRRRAARPRVRGHAGRAPSRRRRARGPGRRRRSPHVRSRTRAGAPRTRRTDAAATARVHRTARTGVARSGRARPGTVRRARRRGCGRPRTAAAGAPRADPRRDGTASFVTGPCRLRAGSVQP